MLLCCCHCCLILYILFIFSLLVGLSIDTALLLIPKKDSKQEEAERLHTISESHMIPARAQRCDVLILHVDFTPLR